MSDLLETDFDCPVCLENLLPPVFQCFNGHLLCSKCIPNLPTCPICREEMPQKHIRNREIEKVILARPTSCQFKKNGCEIVGKHDPMDCLHAVHNFCSHLNLNCKRYISRVDLLLHLMEAHEIEGELTDVAVMEVNQCGVTPDQLKHGGAEWEPVFFVSQDNIFFLRTSMTPTQILWNVTILGSKETASKFGAKIKLMSLMENLEKRYLKASGPVHEFIQGQNADDQNYIFSILNHQLQPFWSEDSYHKGGWKLRIHIYNQDDKMTKIQNQVPVINNLVSGKDLPSRKYSVPQIIPRNGAHRPGHISSGVNATSINRLTSGGERSRTVTLFPQISSRELFEGLTNALGFGITPRISSASAVTLEHPDVNNCHACRISPIVGNRYKCLQCENFDLCPICVKRNSESMHFHVFIMITSEVQKSKMHNIFTQLRNWSAMSPTLRKTVRNQSHVGVTCSGCRMSPIIGARHKCVDCKNYDLCYRCVTYPRTHVHDIFLAIESPELRDELMSASVCITLKSQRR